MYTHHGFIMACAHIGRLTAPLKRLIALATAVLRTKHSRQVATVGEHLLQAMANSCATHEATIHAVGGPFTGCASPPTITLTGAVHTQTPTVGTTHIGVALADTVVLNELKHKEDTKNHADKETSNQAHHDDAATRHGGRKLRNQSSKIHSGFCTIL